MTKRLFLVAAFVIIALSLFLSPAFAAYSWVDDNGVFHITDYPKPVKREEPKDTSAPEVTTPPATAEVKQSPMQTAPQAPTPPQGQISQATATVPLSTGTPTMRPAAPVSQHTPTQGGHEAMATGATVSLLTTTASTTVPLPGMQEQPQTALPVPREPQMPTAGAMAFVAAFFMIIVVLSAGIYIYYSLCLYLIAKKLNVPSPWTAWIPIVNIWTLLQAAGKPCWWVLLLWIPFIPIYLWMCITENLGRNKWLGLLIIPLIPIVSLVYIGVLAFSKQEQQAGAYGQADVGDQE